MTIAYYSLLLAYAILQLADYITTIRALGQGATEANPVMAKLISCFGRTASLVLAKVLATVPFLFLVPSRSATIVLAFLCALYVATLINNLTVLRRLP